MPATASPDEVWHALEDLLTGRAQASHDEAMLPGAELVVTDEGTEVFRAALARHARRDEDDPAVIWIRRLAAAGRNPQTQLPAFDPSIVRRRALHMLEAHLHGHQLKRHLATGQRAIIQPAEADHLAVLQDWDTWMVTLTDDEHQDLDSLLHD